MRTLGETHEDRRTHNLTSQTGNWMQLTIAPLVAERLVSGELLPGAKNTGKTLGSVVDATGRTGLANYNPAEVG